MYENGDIFVGTFTDGTKNGKGVLTNKENTFKLEANYKMGIKEGPYYLIDKNNEYE